MRRIKHIIDSRRAIIVTIAFLSFFVVFIGMIFNYIQKFDRALEEENKAHLSEISNHITLYMTRVVRDTQESLKTAATAVLAIDNQSARLEYLRGVAEQYSFAYIGYAGLDGKLYTTADNKLVDVHDERHFKMALEGKSTITDLKRRILKDRAVTGVLVAVPLGTGEQAGMLVAMLDIAKLSVAMSVENFGGAGYSYVIDKRGELVLRNKSLDFNNLYQAWGNVEFAKGYSLDKILADIAEQRSDLTIYSNMGVDKYAYYCPLGLNSWTVVNVVSKDVIAEKALNLTRDLALIGVAMVLIFLVLVVLVLINYGVSLQSQQTADAKSAFLANMSHEIRTPMNVIVGISEILMRENLTPKQKEAVITIINSGKGLLTIINDILDISKMEAGKYSMTEEPYELESLLYDLTAVAAMRIGDKPVDFLLEPAPDIPRYLIGDMSRIKQMLLNIVGNAVKFTMQGSIRLIIDYSKDSMGILLRIKVKDTGIGIKEKDIDKLFVSFNQVDTRRNRNIEGTGLGLAIAKNLCEMMGGKIWVESEYGKGSSFTMTVRQGVADTTPLLHMVLGKVRILVCEPSESLQTYEASCMDKIGVQYEFCATKQEFVAKLAIGGYTHGLAGRAVLKELGNDSSIGNVQMIRMLGLKEHNYMDPGRANVYLPLFASQLSLVLQGGIFESLHVPKCIGVDMNMIEPMPCVRILIVDDNEVNLQVAMGLMNPYRMQMECALSGYEAIEAVQHKDYDLVLMDHMMPGMDGVETTRQIRELGETYKQLPIVALTANATADARQLFINAGFNGFLAKPIETAKLHEVLSKWLRAINAVRAAEQPIQAVETQLQAEEEPFWLQAIAAEEVDFHQGLSNFGSLTTYVGILRTYLRTTEPKLQELTNLAETDFDRFIIEIHGLKSASAAIAAFGLASLAEALEQQGKMHNIGGAKIGLPHFLKRAHKALQEISKFLQRTATESGQSVAVNNGEVLDEAKLDALEKAFLDYDTEQLQILLKGSNASGSETEQQFWANLKKYYEEYEFDLPVQLIDAYRKRLKSKR